MLEDPATADTLMDVSAPSPNLLRLPGVAAAAGPAEEGVAESKDVRLLYKPPICACTRFRRAIA